jgi:hypothetical protein
MQEGAFFFEIYYQYCNMRFHPPAWLLCLHGASIAENKAMQKTTTAAAA